jgi:hypothetical protein
MEPSPCTPSLLRAFERHQEQDLKHPGSVELITTKQNKTNYLPSEINNPSELWNELESNSFDMMIKNVLPELLVTTGPITTELSG